CLLASLDRLLILISRLLNLALREALLHRRDHAAERINLSEVVERAVFHLFGQRLDEVRTAERVNRVYDASLFRDDLLCAKRNERRLIGRQRECFVVSICVQTLRAAEHTGERLNGHADDVVQRLLHSKRDACGLCVKTQLQRARISRVKAFAHGARPDAAGGAILGDLLEEIVMRVEEKRDARHKLVNVKPGSNAPLHILDAVAQGERKLLQRGRARLAYRSEERRVGKETG